MPPPPRTLLTLQWGSVDRPAHDGLGLPLRLAQQDATAAAAEHAAAGPAGPARGLCKQGGAGGEGGIRGYWELRGMEWLGGIRGHQGRQRDIRGHPGLSCTISCRP